jgi:hypothetical protein
MTNMQTTARWSAAQESYDFPFIWKRPKELHSTTCSSTNILVRDGEAMDTFNKTCPHGGLNGYIQQFNDNYRYCFQQFNRENYTTLSRFGQRR